MDIAAQLIFFCLTDTLRVGLENYAYHIDCPYFRRFGFFRQQVAVGEEEITDLQSVVLYGFRRAVHLVFLVLPIDRKGRRRVDGKLSVPLVIASLDSRHGRGHQVAVSAVGHAQRLGGAGECGLCPHGVVGNPGIGKLIYGLRHLDDGQG